MSTGIRAWEAAARAYGVDPEPRLRPNVGRWLLYALWHQLPERHRIWVLYDATCATWVWRHFARIIAIVTLPTIALAVLLPAPPALRVTTALVTGGLAVLCTGVWVNESTEHRLVQAGWPWQFASALREERSVIARRIDESRR